MQTALRLLFPPRCLICGDLVEEDHGLCASCWRETPFLSGLVCDLCGAELPGGAPGEVAHCDDCLATPRPWSQGRSVLSYADNGTRLVLALKHQDRTDIARPAGAWMAQATRAMALNAPVVVPVPLHPWRLLRRRYNQAALLSGAVARHRGWRHLPDLLLRPRRTRVHKDMSADARFANMDEAITLNPRHAAAVTGQEVLLIDDVMTSGATLDACCRACLSGGAKRVAIQTLARVAKPA